MTTPVIDTQIENRFVEPTNKTQGIEVGYDVSTYGNKDGGDYVAISVGKHIKQYDNQGNFIGSGQLPIVHDEILDPIDDNLTCIKQLLCVPEINIPDSLKDLVNGLVKQESVTQKTLDDVKRLADSIEANPLTKHIIHILGNEYHNLPEAERKKLTQALQEQVNAQLTVQIPDKEPDYNDLSAYLNAPFPELEIEAFKENEELKKMLDLVDKLALEDLNIPVIEANHQDVTSKTIDGTGSFDRLATALFNQLQMATTKTLLSKEQFAQVYSEVLVQGIQTSHQFVLEQANIKNQSYALKIQAIQASLAVLQAKAELLMLPSKLRLAYAQIEAQLKQIELLKVQTELEKEKFPQIVAQTDLILAQTDTQRLQNEQLQVGIQSSKIGLEIQQEQHKQSLVQTQSLLKDIELKDVQKVQAQAQIKLMAQQLESEKEKLALNKAQLANAFAQMSLIKEQSKVTRAQISDTINGKKVGGVLGAQINVNKAQAVAFERDSFNKFLNQLQSGWAAKKTSDIATLSPNAFNALGVDRVINWYATKYFNMPNDTFRMPSHYSDYLTDDEMDGKAPTDSAGNLIKDNANKNIAPNTINYNEQYQGHQ